MDFTMNYKNSTNVLLAFVLFYVLSVIREIRGVSSQPQILSRILRRSH